MATILNYSATFPFDAKVLELDAEIYNTLNPSNIIKAKLLLDTGASVTTISTKLLQKLGISAKPTGHFVTGASGSSIPVYSSVFGIKLSPTFDFRCCMFASKVLPVDMLLGMDILSQFNHWSIGRTGSNDIKVEFQIVGDD